MNNARKYPDWWLALPKRARNKLAAFTPHRDGYFKWYRGQSRGVCGRLTPPEQVESRWIAKRQQIDDEIETAIPASDNDPLLLIELTSLFYTFNDERVANGKPRRMSPFTARDYQNVLNQMIGAIGPKVPVDELCPLHFAKFATAIANDAASRFSVKVAYLHAFFNWALKSGHLADNQTLLRLVPGQQPLEMLLGPSIVKPSAEQIRDEQVDKDASYSPTELRTIWNVATFAERLWIGLGLNCAYDNADLGSLIRPCVDLAEGCTDFRRRKRGKIRRVSPLVHRVLRLARTYRRPNPVNPDHEDLFFLTPTGLPLQRLGPGGQMDYINTRWGKLLIKAGLRPKPERITIPNSGGKRRQVMPEYEGERRGYRGIRTTFPNLMPPGYEEETEIIMGHAQGTILLDHYLKKVGWERLNHGVIHVWHRAFLCPQEPDEECRCGLLNADGRPVRMSIVSAA